ncbi:MAG: exodeoxyribonuclease V subunit alpha [Verrucomicrobiota bacterium]
MEKPERHAIDRHFAALLGRLEPSSDLRLAAELVSRLRAEGHVCLPLREVNAEILQRAGITAPLPKTAGWIKTLRASKLVGGADGATPLVLDGSDRLYLRRYWRYEQDVAANLRARAERRIDPGVNVARHCNEIAGGGALLQQLAAYMAATSSLTVISGAPGTGKTRTVALICALLLAPGNELEIALAAPTGKAAARLKEALTNAKTQLPLPADILARLPTEASTIQRLLGVMGDSGKFRHDARNPLRADVVIVDEASMIDLALLAKLLAAVRPEARLILVGDKDQLSSVEAGSAFRDICTPGGEPGGVSEDVARDFTKMTGAKIAKGQLPVAPIQNCVVELRENFRFIAGAGIAELSAAVNRGAVAEAEVVLRGRSEQVKWKTTPNLRSFPAELRKAVLGKFEVLRQETNPAKALVRLSDFIILCALRRGPFGTRTINRLLERFFFEGGETAATQQYFAGQPIIVVENDYQTGLFNGDLGIVLGAAEEQRVYFPGEDGTPRSFTVARLPEHETAFALTIHKSQGSEFNEALVILPDQDSPILTRELIYTAVTRVRRRVDIWTQKSIFATAIGRTVRRHSGLREALWGEGFRK